MLKKISLSIIAITFFGHVLHAQEVNNKPYKGKIIAGSLLDAVGTVMIVHAVLVELNPIYGYDEEGIRTRRQKAIPAAVIGGIFITVGTINIVKGIKIKKGELTAGINPNGFRLLYRF